MPLREPKSPRGRSEGSASNSKADLRLTPFLKWPGGKRWAADEIASIVQKHLTGRYYEPFLGGGAVFFQLRPPKATLSDVNAELIAGYQAVQKRHTEVISALKQLPVSKATYNRISASKPGTAVSRAVRFLYLNRTGFGGMYRVNKQGTFNVPFGGGERTPAILWERAVLSKASEALQGVSLRTCDFASAIQHAREGDVVYCDPTYTVAHDRNGFVRYNEHNFTWADQLRLADVANRACTRGAVVIISNAHHRSVLSLYPKAVASTLTRFSRISPIPSGRRVVREYLFVLRP